MTSKFNLLQIYRGLAAMMVVLLHLSYRLKITSGETFLYEIFKFGGTGVDFFFVLSGFIITYIHYKDLSEGRKVKSFFSKRFVRIYPMYWFVCIIHFLIYFLPDKGAMQANGLEFYIKSFLLIKVNNGPFLRVGWTLTYEIIFYFLFGLLILIGRKSIAFIFFILWCSAILLFNFSVLKDVPIGKSFYFQVYNLEFLLGCFIGYLANRKILPNGKIWFSLGIFSLILTYSLLFLNILDVENSSTTAIIGISYAILIYGSISKSFDTVKYNKTLLLIGNASYTIYLVHMIPVKYYMYFFVKFKKLIYTDNLLYNNFIFVIGFIAMLAIILLVSIALHLFVEKPLINYFKKKIVGE